MNNKELIQEYLEVEIDKENTRKAYENNLARFEQYIQEKNFLEVLPKDLKLYMKGLTNVYSQGTINQITATLKDFFTYLYENEYMKKNISSGLGITKSNVITEPKEKEYLTLEEIKIVLSAIENIDESTSRAKHKTEELESEIRETKLSDIDLEKKIITVEGIRRKNGETLTLPLDDELVKKINSYLIERRRVTLDLDIELFVTVKGKPMCNSDMNRLFKKRVEQANLPFEVHMHMLRHSCSMVLQQQGVSLSQVAKVLGQKSSNVTFGSYTHMDMELIKEKNVSMLG